MTHDHAHTDSRRRLLTAISIVSAVLVVEVVGAVLSGSLVLLADAGHMLSDLLGLGVALTATLVAARPATDRQTFGFRRAEVFGALVNGLILVAVAVAVTAGAVGRLVEPAAVEVEGVTVLVVAAITIIANLAAMAVLRPASTRSLNLRGAYLEVFGDLLGSLAALAAGTVILTTGFLAADAIASLVIAALILPRAFLLLRDVVRVLSEAAPEGTDVALIREHILGVDGVVDVHDVHVWAITSGAPVFTAHVVVVEEVFADERVGPVLDGLAACLEDHFDVAHSTFQLEPVEHAAHEQPHHR